MASIILAHTAAIREHGQTNPGPFTTLKPLKQDSKVVWSPAADGVEPVEDAEHLYMTSEVPSIVTPDKIALQIMGLAKDQLSFLLGKKPSDWTEDATQEYYYLAGGAPAARTAIEMFVGGKAYGATYGWMLHFYKGRVTKETGKDLFGREQPSFAAEFEFLPDPDGSTDNKYMLYNETAAPPPAFMLSVSPVTAATGATLTFTGKHFGATEGTSVVYVGAVPVVAVTSWSDTEIVCTCPTVVDATNYACSVKITDAKTAYSTVNLLGATA